jgi:hypothetical protein
MVASIPDISFLNVTISEGEGRGSGGVVVSGGGGGASTSPYLLSLSSLIKSNVFLPNCGINYVFLNKMLNHRMKVSI